MSDAEQIPEAAPADPSDSIRAELEREYAGKLAGAHVEAQAAKAGITLPEGFTGYLNTSTLLGEDGNPSAEAIARLLESFEPASKSRIPPLKGAMHNRGGGPLPTRRRISLDVRKR